MVYLVEKKNVLCYSYVNELFVLSVVVVKYSVVDGIVCCWKMEVKD